MLRRIAGKFAGIFKQPPAMPSQLPRIAQPSKMVELGGKMYRLSKAERVYKELTNPRSPGVFYRDNRAIGTIDKNGEVRFSTQWDELANRDDTPGGF